MTSLDSDALKSPPAPLQGVVEPRIQSPRVDLPTHGDTFIAFCERINYPLLPWQQYLARELLRYKEDGRWYHSEAGVIIARQNGKSTFMALLIIWAAVEFGSKLQIHTAHKLTTSNEIFLKVDSIIQGNDELSAIFGKKYESKGSQEIRFLNGSRYLVRANNSAARGIAAPDFIHLDECREYQDPETWASLRYTQMSSLNPMAIVYSNAGDQHSVVLNKLRERGLAAAAGADDPIGWFEWSAPYEVAVGDTPEFWEAVTYSNPSLGHTIHPDNLRSILSDDESTIRTEVLCQWVSVTNPAINPSNWEACGDESIKLDREQPTWMAIDLSPDRKEACLLGAQQIGDKFIVVLLQTWTNPINIDDKQMANDVASWVRKFSTETVAYSRQTAGAVAARLAPAGINTTPIDGALYGQACDEMLSAITSGRLIHPKNEEFTKQVLSAVKLPFKDGGWYLGRKASNSTICAAVCMAMVSHFAVKPESEIDIIVG